MDSRKRNERGFVKDPIKEYIEQKIAHLVTDGILEREQSWISTGIACSVPGSHRKLRLSGVSRKPLVSESFVRFRKHQMPRWV